MVERCQITKRSTGRRSVPTADVAATGEDGASRGAVSGAWKRCSTGRPRSTRSGVDVELDLGQSIAARSGAAR